MEVIQQTLEQILESLSDLRVDWKDETARRVIDKLRALARKDSYNEMDVRGLLDCGFDDGILICRLFLGMSKDQFAAGLRAARDGRGISARDYREGADEFVRGMVSMGLLDAMRSEATRELHWTDVLVERLRSGRGSAISGQKRGRSVEDFVESVIRRVFGSLYDSRCSFTGARGNHAKCDFAIPAHNAPRILVEAKGYGATGSKMTDVLGDIQRIIDAKRPDTSFLLFTDGLTWRQRKSDLKKIIEFQNNGDIARVYTFAMAEQFERDLRQMRSEYRLEA